MVAGLAPSAPNRRVGTALVVLALLVFAAFSSYGFTAPVYYGHYG
jgi:hypothetical protein